jgi:tetratricopeptide (TPR) repeat protein
VLLEKLPLVALAVASAVVTIVVQQRGGAVNGLDEIPVRLRVANALVSYVAYLGKMCWPVNLAIFYPFPRSIPIGLAISALVVLVAISVAAAWMLPRRPYIAVGWFWYLVTLAPVIGLIQVGGQAMADRYTYVPLVGIFIIIAWGVPDLLARWPRQRALLPAAAGAVIVACTVLAWTQAGYWRESLDLWQHAVDVTEDNYIAHDAIGTLLIGYGKPAEAVPHFAQAIAVKPTFAQAQYNFGVALMNQDKNAEAGEHFRAALRILPDFAEAHSKLGRVLAQQRQLDAAVSEFTAALRLKPDFAEAHEDLGTVLANMNRMDDAIGHFTEAVRLQPSLPDAHFRLASALMMQARLPEAVAEYSAAVGVKPDFADAWNGRAFALAREGRIDDAISDFHTAVRLNPNFEAAYFNLGLVCRGAGRLDEAVSAFREVLRINPTNVDARQALEALVKR